MMTLESVAPESRMKTAFSDPVSASLLHGCPRSYSLRPPSKEPLTAWGAERTTTEPTAVGKEAEFSPVDPPVEPPVVVLPLLEPVSPDEVEPVDLDPFELLVLVVLALDPLVFVVFALVVFDLALFSKGMPVGTMV